LIMYLMSVNDQTKSALTKLKQKLNSLKSTDLARIKLNSSINKS
jgi:hypothetical protein